MAFARWTQSENLPAAVRCSEIRIAVERGQWCPPPSPARKLRSLRAADGRGCARKRIQRPAPACPAQCFPVKSDRTGRCQSGQTALEGSKNSAFHVQIQAIVLILNRCERTQHNWLGVGF